MAFKDIHKLKKIDVVQKETISIPHLVIGKDIFALSLYTKLKSIYGAENVRLLSEDKILTADLLPKGPGTIRGETNRAVFKKLYPEMAFTAGEQNAVFYKDMAWKTFGSRSKPEALKFDEEFYTGPRFDVDYSLLFPELNESESLIEKMNLEAYQVKIKKIGKNEETFTIECLNGTEFFCEHLYFGFSPSRFMELFEEKNKLSDELIQFCESTAAPSALFVKFIFDQKPLSEMKETLFIPLSYTHEWGHFVGELKTNVRTGQQEIEFMHYLDEDQLSEEDVSRIIRLLKKSMEKIFETFSKIHHKEFISLEQNIGCLKIDDNLFHTAQSASQSLLRNMLFIGVNAPVADERRVQELFEYSAEGLNGITRALVVYQMCEKNLTAVS